MSRTITSPCLVGALGGLLLPFAASAQTPLPPPEPYEAVDAHGVDLIGGTMGISGPVVSVGDPAAGGLSSGVTFISTNTTSGWRHSSLGGISRSGPVGPLSWYIVTVLGQSTIFAADGAGGFRLIEGQGGALVLAGGVYTFTAPDGTIATFQAGVATLWPNKADVAVPIAVIRPNGVRLDYHYKSVSSGGDTLYRPQSITTNVGYQLHFEYQSNAFGPAFRNISAVTALNNAVDACAPLADACGFSQVWPRITLTATTATDALNRTTRLNLSGNKVIGIARPTMTSGWNQTITWSASNQVQSVSDASRTWTYTFQQPGSMAPPYVLTNTITNPLSQTTTMKVQVEEPESVGHGQTRSRIDEATDPLGHTRSFAYDEQGRLFTAYAPEGDYVSYRYNGDGNPTEVRNGPKAGSGLSVRTLVAAYPATCSTPILCRRPTSFTDALGGVTDYTYDAAGNLLTVTGPAPTPGAPRPQTRYQWEQRYAWYRQNGSSAITQATSPVWVQVGSSQCMTGATC